jgi:hypothetical protein
MDTRERSSSWSTNSGMGCLGRKHVVPGKLWRALEQMAAWIRDKAQWKISKPGWGRHRIGAEGRLEEENLIAWSWLKWVGFWLRCG